jgi:hypothetical protein
MFLLPIPFAPWNVKKNIQRTGIYFTISEEETANSSASKDSLAFHQSSPERA